MIQQKVLTAGHPTLCFCFNSKPFKVTIYLFQRGGISGVVDDTGISGSTNLNYPRKLFRLTLENTHKN